MSQDRGSRYCEQNQFVRDVKLTQLKYTRENTYQTHLYFPPSYLPIQCPFQDYHKRTLDQTTPSLSTMPYTITTVRWAGLFEGESSFASTSCFTNVVLCSVMQSELNALF